MLSISSEEIEDYQITAKATKGGGFSCSSHADSGHVEALEGRPEALEVAIRNALPRSLSARCLCRVYGSAVP